MKERDIQIDYLSILIQRISYQTELFLTDIKKGPENLDGDEKSKLVIYTDDPQFEGKRNYFKKFLIRGINFTNEISDARKYDYYPALEIDMNNIKEQFGIECYSMLIK